MNAVEDKVEFLIRGGRFIRRDIQEGDLGSQDQMLANLIEPTPTMLPNFMMVGNAPIHILISKANIAITTELKKLPFNTFFAPNEFGDLTPVYGQIRGAIKIDDPFVIPADWGKTLFTLLLERGSPPRVRSCYLFQYLKGELFRIPYPNVFNDNRICMGHDWDQKNTLGKDIITDFVHALTSFHSTVMNSDLTTLATSLCFKRNLDNWILPSRPSQFLTSSSCAFMSGFAI